MQTDPIRFGAGDINLYGYVFNSVSKNIDPFGLCCESEERELNSAIRDWEVALAKLQPLASQLTMATNVMFATTSALAIALNKATRECSRNPRSGVCKSLAAATIAAAGLVERSRRSLKGITALYTVASAEARNAQTKMVHAEKNFFDCMMSNNILAN